MKLVSVLALASASLLSASAHAAAPDPAPTLSTDAQSGATTLAGAHHLNGAAFSLIVTDWWLSGTIAQGQAQDVRLIVEVHLPQYPLLDRATDAAGRKLDIVILRRGPSERWHKKASERIAILLPHDYAEHARATGLSITVSGKDRSFPIVVPGAALASFLDSYAKAASNTGVPPQPAPEPATPAPAPATPPAEAPAAPPAVVPAPPASSPAASSKAPEAAPPAAEATPAPTPTPSSSPAPTPSPSPSPAPPSAGQGSAPGFPPPSPPPGTKLHSLPGMEAAPSPDAESDKGASSAAGSTTTVASLGLEFAATSSGAMILMVQPGSKADKLGLAGGDFIEGVDGQSIKALSADQMAAKIGASTAKVLNCIAAGNVKLR